MNGMLVFTPRMRVSTSARSTLSHVAAKESADPVT